jgi:hypothetical protein
MGVSKFKVPMYQHLTARAQPLAAAGQGLPRASMRSNNLRCLHSRTARGNCRCCHNLPGGAPHAVKEHTADSLRLTSPLAGYALFDCQVHVHSQLAS